jgi:hypothetical protein
MSEKGLTEGSFDRRIVGVFRLLINDFGVRGFGVNVYDPGDEASVRYLRLDESKEMPAFTEFVDDNAPYFGFNLDIKAKNEGQFKLQESKQPIEVFLVMDPPERTIFFYAPNDDGDKDWYTFDQVVTFQKHIDISNLVRFNEIGDDNIGLYAFKVYTWPKDDLLVIVDG